MICAALGEMVCTMGFVMLGFFLRRKENVDGRGLLADEFVAWLF